MICDLQDKIASCYVSRLTDSSETIHVSYPIRIQGVRHIKIGPNTWFNKFCEVNVWNSYKDKEFLPLVTIGSGCSFGAYNHITCINRITIGDNVLTGKWVTITDNNHGTSQIVDLLKPPLDRDIVSNGEIVIEDNVWLGDKVTVLSGVTIGKGAIVAANAVVSKNVEPYSVVGGIPAKMLKNNKKDYEGS